jgi:long-chain acyl-CoA synthetase
MSDDTRPWHGIYDDFGVPHSLDYPDVPVHALLAEAAEEHPEMGFRHGDRHRTYDDVWERVERVATALAARGVAPGDRVATVLPTSLAFVEAEHAISRCGAVHVPNDFLVAEDDLAYRLERADPAAMVADARHADLAAALAEEVGIGELVLADVTGEGRDAVPDGADLDDPDWLDDLAGADRDPPDVALDPAGDVHTLLFTGGTTGQPKGCQLTHRNLVANARQSAAAQSRVSTLMEGDATVINALPLYHAYGYTTCHMFVDLAVDHLLVDDPRDTEHIVDLIQEYDPIVMLGVPTQFMEVVDEGEDLNVVGVSGSAPLASETRDSFNESSAGMTQGYGLSEMSPVTHFDVEGLLEGVTGTSQRELTEDVPTIGIPVPDTEVALRDPETGDRIALDRAAAEDDVTAEMLLDGPQRMKGYLDGDRSPFTEDGMLPTGDVVKLDEDGRFYVVDRVKDMINVSGLKVYSEEVDEVLTAHPDVTAGATIGVPDPDRPGSERVKVVVERADGDLTAEDVRDHLEGRVAKHAVPSEVAFVDELPRTPIGKVDKERLRDGD